MKSQTLTIIGNVGSGKTTLLPILQKKLHASVIHADNLFQTTNPFRDQFLSDMPRWAFSNELWLTVERVKIYKEHLQENTDKIVLIDSGLLMSWVYAYSHVLVGKMSQEEWDLFDTLFKDLTKDMLKHTSVLYLDYSLPTLMKRIKKRGRDYELAMYTEEYLTQLDGGLKALLSMLSEQNTTIITISEDEAGDFESDKDKQAVIFAKVEKCLVDQNS